MNRTTALAAALAITASAAAGATTIDSLTLPSDLITDPHFVMTPNTFALDGAADPNGAVWYVPDYFRVTIGPITDDGYAVEYERFAYRAGDRNHAAWVKSYDPDGMLTSSFDLFNQGGCLTYGGQSMRDGSLAPLGLCETGTFTVDFVRTNNTPSQVPLPTSLAFLALGLAAIRRISK